MSKYKTIETEFRTLASLKAALADVIDKQAVEYAVNPAQATLHLYGYQGDRRAEKCGIRLPKPTVDHFSGGMSNDIGFAWNGKSYEAIVSEYDQGNSGVQAMVNSIRQRYAVHEVRRQAQAKGYTVQEKKAADGTVQMKLVKR